MPRKKIPAKLKYTTRKEDKETKESILYVKYPLPGLKYPKWRKCFPETQERVNEIIASLIEEHENNRRESAIPENCAVFFDYWLKIIATRVSPRTLCGL